MTTADTAPNANVKAVLKAYIERIESVNEDIKTLNDEKRDIFAEAKGNGFDVKVMKRVIQLRRQDANERAESDTILDTYLRALDMV